MNILGEDTRPILNAREAGAGLSGLMLGFVIAAIGLGAYILHFYFAAILLISIAILIFKTGSQTIPLTRYLARGLLQSGHIERRASDLIYAQQWLRTYARQTLQKSEPTSPQLISEVDSFILSQIGSKKDSWLSDDAVESALEEECLMVPHEGYQYVAQTFEFTAAIAPLIGLVGTILEMSLLLSSFQEGTSMGDLAPGVGAAMKNTLYGALLAVVYKLLAARFKTQIKTLEYDFSSTIALIKTIRAAKP